MRRAAASRVAACLLSLALATIAAGGSAQAQLTNSSAASLAMGNTGTATARGYDAVYWNPAGLGMPGNPRWSIALLPLTVGVGAAPISLTDFANAGGRLMGEGTKYAWLTRVSGSVREQVNALGTLTLVAANVGRVGVQLSVNGGGNGLLTHDALELMLYGNAGRTGTPQRYALAGSSASGGALATLGVSYAQPVKVHFGKSAGQSAAIGVTVHATQGLSLLRAQDNGSFVDNAPVDVRIAFPVVSPKTGAGSLGSGVGADIGAAWQNATLRGGIAIRNLVNSFQWDPAALAYHATVARYGADGTRNSDFGAQAYGLAPLALRNWVTDARLAPTFAIGLAWQRSPRLLVSADAQRQFGTGMPWSVARSVGVGIEVRPVSWLPLRGGAAMLDRGTQVGGGAAIEARGVRLQWAAASRSDSRFGTQLLQSVTVAFGAFGGIARK